MTVLEKMGFAFLETLSARHTVIAPDYPPVQTLDEFITAFYALLQTEGRSFRCLSKTCSLIS